MKSDKSKVISQQFVGCIKSARTHPLKSTKVRPRRLDAPYPIAIIRSCYSGPTPSSVRALNEFEKLGHKSLAACRLRRPSDSFILARFCARDERIRLHRV